ncbi:MAG: hypothetical protein CL920_26560 [Deltaproteobacteria bacterium]|nr:hypothetical protein [Deltaproteobacteria bacterium]
MSKQRVSGPLAKRTYNIEVGHKARPYGKNATLCSCAYFARGPLRRLQEKSGLSHLFLQTSATPRHIIRPLLRSRNHTQREEGR